MPFEKGNNLGGRTKGSPNKSTQQIRDAFHMFVENNTKNFEKWLKEIAEDNPAKAMELVNQTAEYILPKLSRTELKAEIEEKKSSEFENWTTEDLKKFQEIREKYNNK